MSFAASLSRKSSDSKQQLHAEIDAWVSEAVDRTFKPACDAAASTGATSAQCTITHFTQVGSMCTAFVNQQGVLDAVKKCFLAKLAALGFATFGATFHDFLSGALWTLNASWPGVLEHEEAPQPRPSGASAECPVCLEFTKVVALFPCGHTMCSACAGRVVRSACPSCRQRVTWVSQGLFLG